MSTAFVLSGGGSLGAVQVGMLGALSERGIHPDLLIGTSAGAINAGYLGGHGTGRAALDDLATLWRGVRRNDVFPLDPVRHVLAIAGVRPSLCASDGLRHLVESHVPYRSLEDAVVPVHVVTTDLLSGEEVVLSTGDPVGAVVASAAIPGVFPAVHRDDRVLVDGGVANNAAVSQAVSLGADEIYVLPAGVACALEHAPRTALGVAVHALTLLIEQRLIADVARYSHDAVIRVLPPLCPLDVPATDFRHAADLIERARVATGHWLDAGATDLPAQERFLSMHRHHATATPGGDPGCHDASNTHPCTAERVA